MPADCPILHTEDRDRGTEKSKNTPIIDEGNPMAFSSLQVSCALSRGRSIVSAFARTERLVSYQVPRINSHR